MLIIMRRNRHNYQDRGIMIDNHILISQIGIKGHLILDIYKMGKKYLDLKVK